jgi:SpoIIAA-like
VRTRAPQEGHPLRVTLVRASRASIGAVIERLTDMPPGTVGFRATGEIERDDYDNVLTPELNRALAAGELRTLCVIEDLDEIEPRALWADSKLGFDLAVRHHDAWVRSAIVTDIDWMARATRLFAWMIPGGRASSPAP